MHWREAAALVSVFKTAGLNFGKDIKMSYRFVQNGTVESEKFPFTVLNFAAENLGRLQHQPEIVLYLESQTLPQEALRILADYLARIISIYSEVEAGLIHKEVMAALELMNIKLLEELKRLGIDLAPYNIPKDYDAWPSPDYDYERLEKEFGQRSEVRRRAVENARAVVRGYFEGLDKRRAVVIANGIEEIGVSGIRMARFGKIVRSEAQQMVRRLKTQGTALPVGRESELTITPELAREALDWLAAPLLHQKRGSLAVAILDQYPQGALEHPGLLNFFDLVLVPSEAAKNITKKNGLALHVQPVRNFKTYEPRAVDNRNAIPAAGGTEEDGAPLTLGPSYFNVRTTRTREPRGLFFEAIVQRGAELVVGAAMTPHLKTAEELLDPVKRSEIRTELLKTIFRNLDPGIVRVEEDGARIDGDRLFDLVMHTFKTHSEIRKAA